MEGIFIGTIFLFSQQAAGNTNRIIKCSESIRLHNFVSTTDLQNYSFIDLKLLIISCQMLYIFYTFGGL
jgi:hypothetical protein